MGRSESAGGFPVEVLVSGLVAVRRDDRLVEPSAPLVAGVLGALALAGERALSVRAMAEALWPAGGEARKRSTVAVVIHRARRWPHSVAGDGDWR
jgi:DNA-binding SARP family transcriptional activator